MGRNKKVKKSENGSNDDQNEPYLNLPLSDINRRRIYNRKKAFCKSPEGIVKLCDLRRFSQ